MTQEKPLKVQSGWVFLLIILALGIAAIASLVWSIAQLALLDDAEVAANPLPIAGCIGGFALLLLTLILVGGFFIIQPGQARVCILFGTYVGTVRKSGFFWANPFYSKWLNNPEAEHNEAVATVSSIVSQDGSDRISPTSKLSTKISLRARTLNGERLKVNDKMGNPIEIAAMVVWSVSDTARALFDADHYPSYVAMQTETAVRHVASAYAYDHMENDDTESRTITLRSNIEEISESLKVELNRQLEVAGVSVIDARLTHLAYAPEIAQAMLRRQQAEAVIAARKKIVEGAVGMVDMAVSELSRGDILDLDDERKAVMATNLMVVLCGETDAQPVLNAGSLY